MTYSDIFALARVRGQSSTAFHRHPALPRVGLNGRFVVAFKPKAVGIYTVFGVVASFGNETCL